MSEKNNLTDLPDAGRNEGEHLEMDMELDKEIQLWFNDTVGDVLTYLDEAGVGLGIKQAVKSRIYQLCDKKIKPLVKGLGHGQEDEARFNR